MARTGPAGSMLTARWSALSSSAGPARTVSLPAGTKGQGEAVCASLKGMAFEPCFALEKTTERSFRGFGWVLPNFATSSSA